MSNIWDIPPDCSIETNENGWWVHYDNGKPREKRVKKYIVPVHWTICAHAEVEAESIEEAMDLATGIDLDCFDNQEYLRESFGVYEEDIVEVE
jgi:hypothetical protein